ncbi:helix-turn-helix transcriptional regulator [Microbacterium sp. No. 7]|uniref:helix-turn-helix transcriptional regulator n=1 Tax=Microbacterium sp. No. 7 TaxID=1714373 RepID=UPI0006D2872D|nr:WYL domain-containing protein [Microbacterium sp. No. 7]ALJ20473.1 transcriptional regulator [Microbacterium sp. No. 7]
MNRTDRLYALREELRRAGPAGRTADRLAEAFEVSVRTIKRDVSALQQGGFPVWARPGPGGGYAVDASATLPPVNFTDAEVSGLAAAVAAHRGEPFDDHARAALAKVLSVMDAGTRRRSQRLGRRIWIDEAGTPRDARTRRAIERALHEQRVLSLRYRDRRGTQTSRHVDPVFLARTGGRWHLVAHCRERDAIRWFDLDRITAAHTTAEPARDIPVESVGTPPATARPVADDG